MSKMLTFPFKANCTLSSKHYDIFEQNFIYKTWSSKSESTLADSKNPILKEIRMLTFSTGTNIKGPIRQKIGNALEILNSLKKSEIGPWEGGKLITRTPVSHGQSSCSAMYIKYIRILISENIITVHSHTE